MSLHAAGPPEESPEAFVSRHKVPFFQKSFPFLSEFKPSSPPFGGGKNCLSTVRGLRRNPRRPLFICHQSLSLRGNPAFLAEQSALLSSPCRKETLLCKLLRSSGPGPQGLSLCRGCTRHHGRFVNPTMPKAPGPLCAAITQPVCTHSMLSYPFSRRMASTFRRMASSSPRP